MIRGIVIFSFRLVKKIEEVVDEVLRDVVEFSSGFSFFSLILKFFRR